MKIRIRKRPYVPAEGASDEELGRELDRVDHAISASGFPYNHTFMNQVHQERKGTLQGDQLLMLMTIASMTTDPAQGCAASQEQIWQRMNALNQLFLIVKYAGVERVSRICRHLIPQPSPREIGA